MQFSNDFFIELEERLPEYLLDFWGMRNFYHFCESMNFKDFIIESVTSYFGEVDELKLSDAISKLRASQRKKKRDWVIKYYNALENDYRDNYNPLSVEYFRLQSMSLQELVREYRDMSLDDIMEQKKAELTEKVEDWKKNKQLFTQYPVMHIHTAKIKQNAVREDILATAANYISKELKYDFNSNVKLLPTDIAYKPFFSFSASKLDLTEIDGIIQNVVKNGTDGSTFSIIPTANNEHILKNLDKRDYAVYQEIVHIAASSGRKNNNQLLVKVNCFNIAKKIYNYTINSAEVELVKNSIYKLANRRFVYKKGNTRVEYVLVDSIIRDDDENSTDMMLLLGDVVSNAILQKDIIGVSKKMENKLSSQHAYAFIYALQGIRFQLFRDTPDNMVKDLQLNFFEDCVRFNTRSYKKKISIVMEILDDYMNHDIVISNYNYSNDVFSIVFLPIEDSDRQYYEDWLKSHPC